jgi:hypothetical protein
MLWAIPTTPMPSVFSLMGLMMGDRFFSGPETKKPQANQSLGV